MKKFHFSSYWGTWSVLLTTNGKIAGQYVEVDLQPVNGWGALYSVRSILDINVRAHFTSRSARDRDVDVLPTEVERECRDWFGDELFEYICFADILAIIDWDRYKKLCNGGASLRRIAFPQYRDRIPAYDPTPKNELALSEYEIKHWTEIKNTGKYAGYPVVWDDEKESCLNRARLRRMALTPLVALVSG